MLESVIPKLPMRDKTLTKAYYIDLLGFIESTDEDFGDYLMIEKEGIELHFFLHRLLVPAENYGQVYIRVSNIEDCYYSLIDKRVAIHPNAPLQLKPWGQKEFSLLDPDNNLLTFGETV